MRTTVLSTALLLFFVLLSGCFTSSVTALELVEIGTYEDYQRFALGDEHHAALIFFYASWDKRTLEAKKTFVEASEVMTKEHVSGLVMGMVDAGRHPELARKVGVRGFPSMFLYQFSTKPQIYGFGFSSGYNVDSIIEFATHETHTHRGHLRKKREALEEKERTHYDFPHPKPGTVIDLTHLNFNRVIRDPTKTGFVMYYASWCDICKGTMPEVERLAKYFEPDGKVVIARMEVDENREWLEANGLEIEGVPVFYMYPRGRKDKEKGWQYLGERDFDSMSVYVNSNARKPEQDLHEFHQSILDNKPDDKHLPESQRGMRWQMKAMPEEIFGEDGRPHGEELAGMKPIHKMNNVKEGRSRQRMEKGEPQGNDETEADWDTLTDEEKRQREELKMRREARMKQGGMYSGKLPSELVGKI